MPLAAVATPTATPARRAVSVQEAARKEREDRARTIAACTTALDFVNKVVFQQLPTKHTQWTTVQSHVFVNTIPLL
jgi:hypothetical protein